MLKPHEREVEQELLKQEAEIREQLKKTYAEALAEVKKRLKELLKDPTSQSRILQAANQEKLRRELSGILAGLGEPAVRDVEGYLKDSYEDAYLGVVYGMHQDGIGLVLGVDERQVERVVSRPTAGYRFSERLYRDKEKLVQDVKAELSRGIAAGRMYREIARQLSFVSEASLKQAYRIVRTEGHRVQNEAKMDAAYAAREEGAEVVKQWDSTVDKRTRPTHRKLDGQIRELDVPFEVDGKKAMYPGGFGIASEDIWCRCVLCQRVRWALSEEEQKYSREAGKIISTRSRTYREWKTEYLQKTAGLAAAGKGDSLLQEHPEPDYLGEVDFSDTALVQSTLQRYYRQIYDSEVEEAIVITPKGRVVRCHGTKDRIYPDADLKEELVGSYVAHCHPANVTEYSFSGDDIELFLQYRLEELWGNDDKYIYCLTRNPEEIDEQLFLWEMTEENFAHSQCIEKAVRYGIGYRRYRRDD